jgi:phage/plasmid-like protein (TIGR03299 family)
MAHELNIEKGRASMMYVGQVPWHGLGTQVKEAATAEEAITAANLNWRVAKLPLFGSTGIIGVPVKGKYAVVREDKIGEQDCPVFGIVSESYTLLQNTEAFAFFDTIVKDKKAAIYHTAGALGKGERIWILAKLPTDIHVAGKDITNKFLLLSNNHDGKGSVQIKFTPIRVVCQNTLSLALREGDTLRIPHVRDLKDRIQKADEMLNIIDLRFNKIEESFQEMAKVQIDEERLKVYLSEVFPDPKVNEKESEMEREKELNRVHQNRLNAEVLFDQGAGNNVTGISGTLWAAYNGVTELVDHRVTAMNNSTVTMSPSRRLNSIWFGEGRSVKVRAYQIATEKIKEWRN